MNTRVRINHQIKAPELRVIDSNGANLGVITLADALAKAIEQGLDLIEISPSAVPPIAKIMDYGKYQYEANKKLKQAKSKAHVVEVKNVQVKIGTGDTICHLKLKKLLSGWLRATA